MLSFLVRSDISILLDVYMIFQNSANYSLDPANWFRMALLIKLVEDPKLTSDKMSLQYLSGCKSYLTNRFCRVEIDLKST